MRQSEVLEYIEKLELAYDQDLPKKQKQIWLDRFTDFDNADFGRAIEQIIRTRERFPRIATVYAVLDESGASACDKGKLRPAKPWCSYMDETNHTCCWWNHTGQSFGNENPAEDAPEEFTTRQGTTMKLINIAGRAGQPGERWERYVDIRRERDALLDELVRLKDVTTDNSGLEGEALEKRKNEVLRALEPIS